MNGVDEDVWKVKGENGFLFAGLSWRYDGDAVISTRSVWGFKRVLPWGKWLDQLNLYG